MDKANLDKLAFELSQYYAAEHKVVPSSQIDSLVHAMLTEDARTRLTQGQCIGMPTFVAMQAHYIPTWTWIAQTVLVALMCIVAHASSNTAATALAVGIFSAMTVLVGVPTMHASKLHGVAELEYSCLNNAVSVLVARLIVLGCTSALATGIMVQVASSTLNVTTFTVALWACPPFFTSCAGVLTLLRKAPPSSAPVMCTAWTAACSMVLFVLSTAVPEAYSTSSLMVWAVAATLALAWLIHEVAKTCHAALAGLDVFLRTWQEPTTRQGITIWN